MGVLCVLSLSLSLSLRRRFIEFFEGRALQLSCFFVWCFLLPLQSGGGLGWGGLEPQLPLRQSRVSLSTFSGAGPSHSQLC